MFSGFVAQAVNINAHAKANNSFVFMEFPSKIISDPTKPQKL